MAKKRRKVYRKTKTGWKELSPYLKRKAERERQERAKPKRMPKPKTIHIRKHELRPLIREAARAGLVEAIEHTHDFWSVGEGYKKYIDHQITSRSEALLIAVKIALRSELAAIKSETRRNRRKSTK